MAATTAVTTAAAAAATAAGVACDSSSCAWHSLGLHVLYESLGWLAFLVWSLSFYPQALLNWKRKSVIGLNFDFLVFNLTKHTAYLIFNASMFFSPLVQQQYHAKYGAEELIPVSASDVAFSVHAVALTAFTVWQCMVYDYTAFSLMFDIPPMLASSHAHLTCSPHMLASSHARLTCSPPPMLAFPPFQCTQRGGQRVSWTCKAISLGVWLFALLTSLHSSFHHDWLGLVTTFNYIQVVMTTIKYIPQAWFNWQRRSTVGWSISNVLMDLTGGTASLLMMFVQSIDQSSFVNFTGNVGKLALSGVCIGFTLRAAVPPCSCSLLPLPSPPPPNPQRPHRLQETIALDIIFALQHYVLTTSSFQRSSPISLVVPPTLSPPCSPPQETIAFDIVFAVQHYVLFPHTPPLPLSTTSALSSALAPAPRDGEGEKEGKGKGEDEEESLADEFTRLLPSRRSGGLF
ncbi:unnamed protein product [Closterium sp. NIES-53]